MKTPFEYVFPAIRGVQARRDYYISMCPLRLLPKVFLFDEEELVPEVRAQRTLNKARLPEMARYIVDNREDYVFSAITAAVDGDLTFEALAPGAEGQRVGLLHIPMSARFIINDGQHRRAAIELALREKPELADESIAVVFFLDKGLERCQQMFADLNRYAIRPSKSLGVLYDHRDQAARLTKEVVLKSEVFRDVVEMERSTLAQRSRKLFTLSALYSGTTSLFHEMPLTYDESVTLAVSLCEEVTKHMPEWVPVRERKMTAGEVRQDFIHSHGIVLHVLGIVGNSLIREDPSGWRKRLKKLSQIDWARANAKSWEGRAMIGGRVCKSGHNVTLTANGIKQKLGVGLTAEEQRVEDAFLRGEFRGNNVAKA